MALILKIFPSIFEGVVSNWYLRKNLIIVFQLLCFQIVNAQIQTTLRPPPTNQLLATDLLQLSLNNTSPSGYTVVITGTINDDQDTELLQFRTMPFQLNNGLTILQEDDVTVSQIIYSNTPAGEMLHATGLLPTGIYKACVKVLDYQNNNELGTACINQPVNEFMHPKKPKKPDEIYVANKVKKPNELNKHIQFYGTGNLEGLMASRQGYNQTIPKNYFRADLRPGVELINVPLQLNLFYSTEENRARQQMFIVNLSFDESRFKNNLRNLVVEKLKQEALNFSKENAQHLSKLTDLENYSAVLKEPSLLKDAENLKQLQDIRNELKELNLESFDQLSDKVRSVQGESREKVLLDRYNKLKTEYGDISVLESKKVMIDRLNNKVKELQAFKDELEKSGVLEKLQSIEKYDINKLADPQELNNQLKKFGLFKGLDKALSGVRKIGIGNIFPNYSPLILDGIQVIGGTVEVNPGLLYMAGTIGKSKRITTGTTLPFTSYEQHIVAGKFGIGRVEQTHLYMTVLRGLDKINTQTPDTIVKPPEANLIMGMELQSISFKRNLIIRAEAALNELIKDRNAPDADLDESSEVVERVPFFISPNRATLLDYAYTGSAELFLNKHLTVLSYRIKYIGPGYRSFGAPLLSNDVRQNEGRIDQRMFKGQFILSAFYRADADNLLNFKGIKTQSDYIGLSMDVRVRRLPYLHLQYAPSRQVNTNYNSSLRLLAFNSGYNFSISKFVFNTTIAYTSTSYNSNISEVSYDNQFLQVSQFATFSRLTVALSYSRNVSESSLGRQKLQRAEFMSSIILLKKMVNSFAVTYYQKDQLKNTGFWYDLSYPFLPNMNAGIHLQYNGVRNEDDISKEYDEFIGRVRVTFNFK